MSCICLNQHKHYRWCLPAREEGKVFALLLLGSSHFGLPVFLSLSSRTRRLRHPLVSTIRETLDFRGFSSGASRNSIVYLSAAARDERWTIAECTRNTHALRASSRCNKFPHLLTERTLGLDATWAFRVRRCCCCSAATPPYISPEGSVYGRSLRLLAPPVLRYLLAVHCTAPGAVEPPGRRV